MNTDVVQHLVEEFSFFDDWEDRYRHIIELGRALPSLPDDLRNDETRVSGCASQVWLAVAAHDHPQRRLTLHADSDSHIVKGLAAILVRLYNDRPAGDAAQFDAAGVFQTLNLTEHLTAQRANGLAAMIERIRNVAQVYAATSSPS